MNGHGKGGTADTDEPDSVAASDDQGEDDQTGGGDNGDGGSGGKGGNGGNGGKGGRGGNGDDARDAGSVDPLRGIDAAPALIEDCTGFCNRESAVECKYTIPYDVCLRLCVDPASMPVPGAGEDALRKFFDCAKNKVMMCNEETGRPEATNCMSEQFEFNSWIEGNSWLGDAGYY